MQNIKEISDTLRGPKVNARRHWDGENWILEDAKTRKPLLIGTRAQILDEKTSEIRYRENFWIKSLKNLDFTRV